jgi:hypothetical protein
VPTGSRVFQLAPGRPDDDALIARTADRAGLL